MSAPDHAETSTSSTQSTLQIENTPNPPEMLLPCSAQYPAERQRSLSSHIKVHVFQWLLTKESSTLTFSLCRECATSVKVAIDSSLFLRSMKMNPASQHPKPKVPMYKTSFFATGTQRCGNISATTGRGQKRQNKLSFVLQVLAYSPLLCKMSAVLIQLRRIGNMLERDSGGLETSHPLRGELLLTLNESNYDTAVVSDTFIPILLGRMKLI